MNYLKLSEISIENSGQWPFFMKILTAVFIFLLSLGVSYCLFVQEQVEHYHRLQEEHALFKKNFALKYLHLLRFYRERTQMKAIETRFGSLLKQLTTQNEMPNVLEDISKTGLATGLIFELFAPLPEVKHDFYSELPIKIVVIGTYHQLVAFISRVAQMQRIVTLHNFVITQLNHASEKKYVADQLMIQLTAKIYRYRAK